MSKIYDDTCAWCDHDLKVNVLTWQTIKSHLSMPITANYCDEKTCRDENCKHDCIDIASSTPENTEKVLLEVVRRRRKLERLEEEARRCDVVKK